MIYLLKSIPLSSETREAWRNAGVEIIPRSTANMRAFLSSRSEEDVLLNYGGGNYVVDHFPGIVFNHPNMVWKTYTSATLRELIDEFMPERDWHGPHWHKSSGSKGKGKIFHEDFEGGCPIMGGDVQKHVEGEEFRVISVGDRIVQASRKDGNVFNGFDWQWCGVRGVSNNGIIPFLKEGITDIPESDCSIFGWDIIHDGSRPYIIETNTSPGVNEATAGRIVDQIERIVG